MAVYCQQLIDGEAQEEVVVPGPDPRLTDLELLHVKAGSAADKGWDVEWLTDTSFVARKVRWSPDALCERVFRIG